MLQVVLNAVHVLVQVVLAVPLVVPGVDKAIAVPGPRSCTVIREDAVRITVVLYGNNTSSVAQARFQYVFFAQKSRQL